MEIGKINALLVIGIVNGQVELQNQLMAQLADFPRKPTVGESLEVFVYTNKLGQMIATPILPKAQVGELVTLRVKELTAAGAWLDWGLPEFLFMPRGFHDDDLEEGQLCLVKIFYDHISGKVLAKEKLEDELSNDELTVKEKEVVDVVVYRDTPLGYIMIINGKHMGLLHYNEVFKELYAGDQMKGFIKKIKDDNKIDVMIGKPGHTRVEDESEKIIRLLTENNGFLPYHDKTEAAKIYEVFGMSKKTFKMTIGALYKKRKISIEQEGIRLAPIPRKW